MLLKIVKITTSKDDRYSGNMHYVIFRAIPDNGSSYTAMIRESFGNWRLWKDIVQKGLGTPVTVTLLSNSKKVNCDVMPK